jgi:hypothetical protein
VTPLGQTSLVRESDSGVGAPEEETVMVVEPGAVRGGSLLRVVAAGAQCRG